MLWVYRLADSSIKQEVQKEYIKYLESFGYEAHIQDIYLQPAVYIDRAPSEDESSFSIKDAIYFLYDYELPEFSNNFVGEEYYHIEKRGYLEWLRLKAERSKTVESSDFVEFKDLNVGDVFQMGDTKFIKISTVNDNECSFKKYYNYPSNVLIIDKLHYGFISPQAKVLRVKEYHGHEQRKVTLKESYTEDRKNSTQFKNLNIGDVFKITNRDFLYIKVFPMDTGHCKWDAVVLTGDRKGYTIKLTPEADVEVVRDLNDIPAECFKDTSSLKEFASKHLKDNSTTYGGVIYSRIADDTLLSCGVTYSIDDCKTTWRWVNDMENTIKEVIFNDPATIVFWGDGSKTVVKCQDGEKFDEEKGLALCYMKKMLGNKSNFNNTFKKWIKPEPTASYDEKHPELGIQDIPPKNKKEYPSNILRIKTSNLSIIHTYMQEMCLTVQYIANASGLSTKTVKRALTGCPVLRTSILKICGYFDFPIETTRYVED